MGMPVDVSAVMKAAAGIGEARDEPISLSIYIDDTAPADVIAHVRSRFASPSSHVRMTMTYLGDSFGAVHPGDDIAVVVGGLDERVGAQAVALRAAGVPCMVATTLPVLVGQIAQAVGCAVPAGDIVGPHASSSAQTGGVVQGVVRSASGAARAVQTATRGMSRAVPSAADPLARIGAVAGRVAERLPQAFAEEPSGAFEPYVLDADTARAFDERMGAWVVAACHDKRLAFAAAFPFAGRALALDAVSRTAMQNAGVALVPLIPGADMPIITLNQVKMVLEIAAAYGKPMDRERAAEVFSVVAAAFASRGAVRRLLRAVPALGGVVRTGAGFGITKLMGYAAIEYFAEGGSARGAASLLSRGFEVASGAVGVVQEKVAQARGVAYGTKTTAEAHAAGEDADCTGDPANACEDSREVEQRALDAAVRRGKITPAQVIAARMGVHAADGAALPQVDVFQAAAAGLAERARRFARSSGVDSARRDR